MVHGVVKSLDIEYDFSWLNGIHANDYYDFISFHSEEADAFRFNVHTKFKSSKVFTNSG